MAVRLGAEEPAERLEDLELELLLEGMARHYGYDFRGYAKASIKRRMWRRMLEEGLATLSGLQELVLHDPACMERLLVDLSVNVTSMFRDPTFWAALRDKVVPLLRTYPFIRVWNPGCSTGEETWSLAILLHEAGLAHRTRIYATDINAGVLERARAGAYPLDRMQEFTANYQAFGGQRSFSDYYEVFGDEARFDARLLEPCVLAQHNLASDDSFNEFNLIVCRNVLIYFDRGLQDRVHDLFHRSLARSGVLALGHKESIRFSSHATAYDELDADEKLYRRL